MGSSINDGDVSRIEEWRQRNESLEKLLVQKTEELNHKNKVLRVEAALEEVRAKTVAMLSSDELGDAVAVCFAQLKTLGFDGLDIRLCNSTTRGSDYWLPTDEKSIFPLSFYVPHIVHPYDQDFEETLEAGTAYTSIEHAGELKKTYDRIFSEHSEFGEFPQEFKRMMMGSERVFVSSAFMQYGSIEAVGAEPLSMEKAEILKRFAKVFEQTYIRFLDLKKAEGQAREVRVEAALDKVRARTMEMNHSDEMADAAGLLYSELIKLGVMIISCGYVLVDRQNKVGAHYMASPEGSFELEAYELRHADTEIMRHIYSGWEKQEPYVTIELKGQANIDHHSYVAEHARNFPWTIQKYLSLIPEDVVINTINFAHGYLIVQGIEPYTQAQLALLVRFGKVFDLTYRRFLDIKNAEAQAREAQIETSLERIRARALTMHSSGDLIDVANVLWEQMGLLGQPETQASAVYLYTDKSETFDAWYALRAPEEEGGQLIKGKAQFSINTSPVAQEWIDYFRSYKNEYTVRATGEKLATWRKEVEARAPEIVSRWGDSGSSELYFHFSDFSGGSLVMVSFREPTKEAKALQKRTASVFDLGYRRFVDLKKAEAQSYKARIEVALERVRARALAMHEPEELKQVVQVLRHEMGFLGIEELETCSIYIKDDHEHKAECWYALKDADEDEKKLITDHFALDLNDTWVGREMLRFYNSTNEQVSIEMRGPKRKEWIHYCEALSAPLRGYYGTVIPDRTYHLYKFSHGAMGVASVANISEESWGLLKRAASVFSLAYSRFRDLTKAQSDLLQLKLEKHRAEEALTELKATQNQLIHAEKMASLGELTAGIAHEIQNPLNFVNNFSDLSKELLDEMLTELKNANADEAVEIAGDVRRNLEKILHHGKRADAIVKGMLQHSRGNGGVKEPTDINALADEYLRLAFHGLRAKDQSFNATFTTDFDNTIGLVEIMPQDFGRVLLNLITNAFYTVSEKRNRLGDTLLPDGSRYVPTVTVTTKKTGTNIELRVKDNGNGIPDKILNKIFQPFFTTKPTGQGTGLGLSLSYDFVKAQGGEIRVNTSEGEGTEFIVEIPVD